VAGGGDRRTESAGVVHSDAGMKLWREAGGRFGASNRPGSIRNVAYEAITIQIAHPLQAAFRRSAKRAREQHEEGCRQRGEIGSRRWNEGDAEDLALEVLEIPRRQGAEVEVEENGDDADDDDRSTGVDRTDDPLQPTGDRRAPGGARTARAAPASEMSATAATAKR